MSKLDQTIASLAAEAGDHAKPLAFGAFFAEWLGVALAYIVLILSIVGIRPDLADRLSRGPFLAELVLLFATVLACAFSVYLSSFPDMKQKPWGLALPGIPFVGFLLLLSYLVIHPMPATEATTHHHPLGWDCVGCVLVYGCVPAAWIVFRLRKQASTQLAFTGGMSILSGAATACLALRFAEPIDDAMHMLQWHYLPMAAFALIGMYFGERMFKW